MAKKPGCLEVLFGAQTGREQYAALVNQLPAD